MPASSGAAGALRWELGRALVLALPGLLRPALECSLVPGRAQRRLQQEAFCPGPWGSAGFANSGKQRSLCGDHACPLGLGCTAGLSPGRLAPSLPLLPEQTCSLSMHPGVPGSQSSHGTVVTGSWWRPPCGVHPLKLPGCSTLVHALLALLVLPGVHSYSPPCLSTTSPGRL